MATDTTEAKSPGRWRRRIAWLLLLWLAGVVAVSAVSLLLRYLMAWVGLAR